jgi:predicted negative regulator of RcsB-dependent stress response
LDANLTEEQQVELLKKFWKEYGFSIIAGVVLAVLFGFGWRAYRRYRHHEAEKASSLYERIIVDMNSHQIEDARLQARILIHDFKYTPYSSLAALTLAKLAVENDKLSAAIENLRWVLDHGHHHEFRQIARIRLARIYLSQLKLDEALKVLAHVDSKAFIPLILEIQGDIYVKQNKINAAREVYKKALDQIPEQAMMRPLLEMKLYDLPSFSPSQDLIEESTK